ncbi:hypothetical protein ABIA35_000570 [Catenulispora sp. MAP12-49]|uniref:hypothetical protein n=1 Tax=Catenulispora sp. MAP12-49 TaxID=3156302 RepID=UPI003513416D
MTITDHSDVDAGAQEKATALRLLVLEAFGPDERLPVPELLTRIAAVNPGFGTDAAAVKSALASIGLKPFNGTDFKRYYQRSAVVGPVAGGPQLLATLGTMARAAREAKAGAEARLHARRLAEQQRIASDRAAQAAAWWCTRFAVGGVEPPMLTWVGYPLSDSRAHWDQHEPDDIHALAFLGDGMFLAHRSHALGGVDRQDTKHTAFVIAGCGSCGRSHEHGVDGITALGDVLDLVADGTCPQLADKHVEF